jgi:hypothetical protein
MKEKNYKTDAEDREEKTQLLISVIFDLMSYTGMTIRELDSACKRIKDHFADEARIIR